MPILKNLKNVWVVKDMSNIVILGGGIAGISAAYQCKLQGMDATVFESKSEPGGLLNRIEVNGFIFDTAIHLSFASEKEVREIFDKTEYVTHYARPVCWDGEIKLKHPVQNNMYQLPAEEKVELLEGFFNRPNLDVKNYGEWLDFQYGEGIAERWPDRYTRKYWSVEPEELSTTWIGNRMRRADVKEILTGSFNAETENTYYLNEVRYPKEGGYKAFLNPMLEEIEVKTNHQVVSISPDGKKVVFDNGHSETYTDIISTIPLPEIIKLIDDVPEDVVRSAESLYSTDMNLFSVGFNREDIPKDLFYYIYDEDMLTARVYSPSIKSSKNAPQGCSSLQFEIYSSHKHPRKESVDEMKRNVIETIKHITDASEDEIMFIEHRYVKYANVVFELGMEENRDVVRDWLREQDIITAGRFGEWGYLWSNQSMMSGLNAAKGLIKE